MSNPKSFVAKLVVKPEKRNEFIALQTELARMDCYTMAIDGDFGPGSQRAVAAYYDERDDADRPAGDAIKIRTLPTATSGEQFAVVGLDDVARHALLGERRLARGGIAAGLGAVGCGKGRRAQQQGSGGGCCNKGIHLLLLDPCRTCFRSARQHIARGIGSDTLRRCLRLPRPRVRSSGWALASTPAAKCAKSLAFGEV